MKHIADTDARREGAETPRWLALLRHPLVVGAALGVLASLLIPSLTRVWQDRPRELALKRELVERISTVATEAIDNGNLFDAFSREIKSAAERNKWLRNTRHGWQVDTSVTGSQLTTYFHRTSLPKQWNDFRDAVGYYFQYEAKQALKWYEAKKGLRQKEELRQGPDSADADLASLHDHFSTMRFRDSAAEEARKRYLVDWATEMMVHQALPKLLFAERDELENSVVESNASGFSHGFWIFK